MKYFSAFSFLFFSFFFFFTYCVWGLPFPGFKESWILSLKTFEFFLPFGFCPPKVGPVVCVSFIYDVICSQFLPVSSSFIWTSLLLVCSFICVVFLCLFIFSFLTYCAWGLLFPGFKVEFFLPFGFCPPKVGPSGLCKLHIGWDLCWVFAFFVCLFSLWWARLNEVVIQSADDLVCIFVSFVV